MAYANPVSIALLLLLSHPVDQWDLARHMETESHVY